MPEQHYTIFVSSTHLDNEERRQLVRDAILLAGMMPLMAENFGAMRPLETCIEEAAKADLVLCILGHRYGTVPPEEIERGSYRSYIELEYEANPERLVFLIDPKVPYVDEDLDPGPERYKKCEARRLFRERACHESYWTSFDDRTLSGKVLDALNKWKARHAGTDAPKTSKDPQESGAAATAPQTAKRELEWPHPTCPFPGLGAFDRERARLYAGREDEVKAVSEEILRRLGPGHGDDVRWVQIEGASGTGKSSFVRAGIMPSLERWSKQGGVGEFQFAVLRPLNEPLRNLALALSRCFPDQEPGALKRELAADPERLRNLLDQKLARDGKKQLVLVLDQLEELFTYAPDAKVAPAQAQAHAAELTALSDNLAFGLTGWLPPKGGNGNRLAPARADQPAPLILLTTIRRDYLGELAQLKSLDALTNRAAHRVLQTMDAKALERAVRRPAEAAGLEWEPPELPALIARDAVEAPGRLALLGHALEALWQRRQADNLTEAAYKAIGGVSGALAGQAAKLLVWIGKQSRPNEDLGRATRSGLLALVRVEADGRVTRKILPRAEFLASTGLNAGRSEWLLTVLTGQRVAQLSEEAPPPPRLVSVDGQGTAAQVEIVHEHLLVSWSAKAPNEPSGLADWIRKERERLLIRERFEAHASEWQAAGASIRAVDTKHLYRRYRSAQSHNKAALAYLRAANQKRKLQLVSAIFAGLFALWHGWIWWQGVQQERYDRRIEGWSRAVAEWPVTASLETLEQLEIALSETELTEVEERAGKLEAREAQLSWSERGTLAAVDLLVEAGPRLRARLEDCGSLPSPLSSEGREQLETRWEAVLAQDGNAPQNPRYDLYPLERAGLTKPQFLVLGTGHAPTWNDAEQRWNFGPETGVVVAYLPGGKFEMGSSPADGRTDEYTKQAKQRSTTVSDFYIQVTEWTEGHESRVAAGLEEFWNPLPSAFPRSGLSWNAARARAEAIGGRLPTEAEWEFACRAGNPGAWCFGDVEKSLTDFAWFVDNSKRRPHQVGLKRPNDWGLYDVYGNVWEWCADWYATSYDSADSKDPRGPTQGRSRVVRGGSHENVAQRCRSASRAGRGSLNVDDVTGFRVVLLALPADP